MKTERLHLDESKCVIFFLSCMIILGEIAERYNIKSIQYIALIMILFWIIDKPSKYYAYTVAFLLCAGEFITFYRISVTTLLTVILVIKRIFVVKNIFDKNIILMGVILVLYSGYFLLLDDLGSVLIIIKTWFLLAFIQISFLETKDLVSHTRKIIKYLVVGGCFTATSSLVINRYFLNGLRWGISEAVGVNGSAIWLALIFSISLIGYAGGLKRNFCMLCAMVSGFFCFLTGSRSGILLLVCASMWTMCLVLIQGTIRKKQFFLAIGTFGIVLLVLGVALNPSIQESIVYMIRKTIQPKGGDISNGRFILWTDYLTRWQEKISWILLGGGSYSNLKMNSMAHNMYIEQLTQFGIIGNFLILSMYYIVYRNVKKKCCLEISVKRKKAPYIIFVNIFISGITFHSFLNINYTIIFWIGIMLIFTYKYLNISGKWQGENIYGHQTINMQNQKKIYTQIPPA